MSPLVDPDRAALPVAHPLGDTRTGDGGPADSPPTGSFHASPAPYGDFVPHARGGIGEVFRATDAALNRTVAVKRLQDNRASDPESRRRFLVEAEVTARLEHPGVVPVYALFTDDRGGPAYAMRFVQGPTLWDALKEYHAGPPDPVAFRRLLQSFIQVCQTVAYAHTRGVIHRDLKPQNILLGKFGETLVVDWGLAKVVGRPEEIRAEAQTEGTLVPHSDGSGSETAMGSAVGTPAYMSPEQAAGRWDVVTQPSDVYSLGAVLYTILTARPPLDKGNWPEMQQRIQRGDFPRPRQVKAETPRSLEAVCLKAMALAPAARYPSAEALAADVEHWMADEPVAAYRESITTRSRRWMRNHRTLVSTAAVLLVTALGASGAGLVLLGQKNREVAGERNAAQVAADEAGAVNAFLTDDLLGQADPDANSRDKKVTVEELLNRAARKIDGNPKFADKPTVEATLRFAIGKTYFKLSNMPEAEKNLRAAVDLRRSHLPPDDPRTLAAQEALADFLIRGLDRPDLAVGLARETWEARVRVLGAEDRDTLDSLDTYAGALQDIGQKQEAIGHMRHCLEARRRTLGPDDIDTFTSMNNLALILNERGERDEAIALLRECLAFSDRSQMEDKYAITASTLATTLLYRGNLAEAETLFRASLKRAEERLRPDHQNADRLRGLLARCLLDRNRLGEAVSLSRRVLDDRRPGDPKSRGVGLALIDLGRGLATQGQWNEAVERMAECREIFTKAAPPMPFMVPWAAFWFGVSLAGAERYDEAEPILITAEAALRADSGTPKHYYRIATEQLISFYERWGKAEKAAVWRKRLAELPLARVTGR